MALRLSGLASGMDTESIVAEMMKAQRLKSTKIKNKVTTMEWKQDKWKTLNTKLYAFYTGPLAKLKMQGSFNVKKVSSSNEAKAEVTASTDAPSGTHSLQIKQLASAQFVTGKSLTTDVTSSTMLTTLGFTAADANKITIDAGTTPVSLTITADTTVGDFTTALKDAGLNASYDAGQKRFFISSKESGYENAFSISTVGTVDLSLLGLSAVKDNGDGTVSIGATGTLVEPKDAEITYNGVDMTSSSNTITANGLTFVLKGVTTGLTAADDETISLNVTDDTQAVFDMVKEFVKSYNELMKEMNESYNAASAKGYDPLTDEEKESMSESQIDDWEKKIKDALLRRDETISSLTTTLRSTLSESFIVNGQSYSLSNFGVGSINYTEKGLLHINGDSDDSYVSGKSNDLMKALTEDPDTVMKVFNGLAEKVYKTMTEDMSSSSLRSAFTLYNDKEMSKQITDYKSDLKKLEDKLQKIEDRYYKQFSAMETAMAKMNSESSSLASMMGTGNNQ